MFASFVCSFPVFNLTPARETHAQTAVGMKISVLSLREEFRAPKAGHMKAGRSDVDFGGI